MKHGIHCGTRPWSADEVHGKLSHHTPGDRHESGAKSGAKEPACFSRIVPAVLESILHVRLAPRTVARGGRPQCVRSGGDRRGNPCSLRSFNRLGRTVRSMSTVSQRTCPSCGNEFSGAISHGGHGGHGGAEPK